MSTVSDVTILTSTTAIVTVADAGPLTLWNPGPADVDLHLKGPAGVADDITIGALTGIVVSGNQRVDGIVSSGTGTIQILRGVRPGG